MVANRNTTRHISTNCIFFFWKYTIKAINFIKEPTKGKFSYAKVWTRSVAQMLFSQRADIIGQDYVTLMTTTTTVNIRKDLFLAGKLYILLSFNFE